MLSSLVLLRWRSSAILPSSSAIGFSKSRKVRMAGSYHSAEPARPQTMPAGRRRLAAWASPRAAMASALRTSVSAWRIEATSIIRPSKVTAPVPFACASAIAARMRRALSTSSAARAEDVGCRLDLARMDHPLAVEAEDRRRALPLPRHPASSLKSANGPSIGRSPLARAATTIRQWHSATCRSSALPAAAGVGVGEHRCSRGAGRRWRASARRSKRR